MSVRARCAHGAQRVRRRGARRRAAAALRRAARPRAAGRPPAGRCSSPASTTDIEADAAPPGLAAAAQRRARRRASARAGAALLTRRGLRPLARGCPRRRARSSAPATPSRRLPDPRGEDEVAELARDAQRHARRARRRAPARAALPRRRQPRAAHARSPRWRGNVDFVARHGAQPRGARRPARSTPRGCSGWSTTCSRSSARQRRRARASPCGWTQIVARAAAERPSVARRGARRGDGGGRARRAAPRAREPARQRRGPRPRGARSRSRSRSRTAARRSPCATRAPASPRATSSTPSSASGARPGRRAAGLRAGAGDRPRDRRAPRRQRDGRPLNGDGHSADVEPLSPSRRAADRLAMLMARSLLAVTCAAFALLAASANANTSHDGWPQINGMLLMNKTDSSRPLDARPGRDPFHGPTRATRATRSTSAAAATRTWSPAIRRTPPPATAPSGAGSPQGTASTTSCSADTAATPSTRARSATSCGATTSPAGSRPLSTMCSIGGVGTTTSTPATATTGSRPTAATTGQGPFRSRDHRLWRRQGCALHLAPGAAWLQDPPLRHDLPHHLGY